MADIILRDTDPSRLRADIAADVVAALVPMLTDSLSRPKSRDEMAEWLGVGVATLDRMSQSGQIPSVLLNRRRVFIPGQVIDALTVNHRTETVDEKVSSASNPLLS